MAQARLNVQAPIERLFAERWSTRAFDAEARVSREHIAACLEAARWAPSCYGEQPWRFIVADRFADEAAWQCVLDALAQKNRGWAQAAPVFVVTACLPTFSHNGEANRWCEHDAGQATLSLCLQATALGLASHQMGGFDESALRTALGIPEEAHIMSVTALGHPAPADAAPEAFREMESAPRQRKPMEEIAFASRWGEGWTPPSACGWEARYQETAADALPWFHAGLDPDIARALDELGLTGGRLLDLGCGPGTQAVALAGRGFEVTASDVSPSAVEGARARAEQAGAPVRFVVDDVLDSRLDGPFDIIVDRGVFHCFARDEERQAYARHVARLLAPEGVLLLKCFHKKETREQGPPSRLDEADIRAMLGEHFRLMQSRETIFGPGQGNDSPPKALFCILQRKESDT